MSKAVISSIILAIIIFCVWLFLFAPIYSQIKSTNAAISKTKANLAEKQNMLNSLNELETEFNSLQTEIPKINEALPSSQQLPELMVGLPVLISQNGMILKQISFGSPVYDEVLGFSFLDIKLSVSGPYVQMQRFVSALERNLRIFDVRNIDFSSDQPSRDGAYQFNISGKTYFRQVSN